MRSISDVFPSHQTLRAEDLPAGIQIPVVIDGVKPVHFHDGNKLRVSFRGKRRSLLAGKTNAVRIAEQLGDDFTRWPGKTIYIERSETELLEGGEIVECIRVVENPPAVPAARFSF